MFRRLSLTAVFFGVLAATAAQALPMSCASCMGRCGLDGRLSMGDCANICCDK